MYEYSGSFIHWEKELYEKGINFDVTYLCGATFKQIDNTVKYLISLWDKGEKDAVIDFIGDRILEPA